MTLNRRILLQTACPFTAGNTVNKIHVSILGRCEYTCCVNTSVDGSVACRFSLKIIMRRKPFLWTQRYGMRQRRMWAPARGFQKGCRQLRTPPCTQKFHGMQTRNFPTCHEGQQGVQGVHLCPLGICKSWRQMLLSNRTIWYWLYNCHESGRFGSGSGSVCSPDQTFEIRMSLEDIRVFTDF